MFDERILESNNKYIESRDYSQKLEEELHEQAKKLKEVQV